MMLNTQIAQIRQSSQKTLKKLHKLVLAVCKFKLHEIAKELKISEGSIFTILHEHLSMRKLCSKWVLRLLTVDQKQYVDNSECCFQLFQHNKKEFLHKYVTMDETWITTSLQSQIGSQLSGQWPKAQTSGRLGFGFYILGYTRYSVHQLTWKRKNHQ